MPSTAFKRIGLTGGIGSGKTTLGRMLISRGFDLIDADTISKELTGKGGAAIDLIRDTFGERFISPDGSMDRNAMRQLVFSQPKAKTQLEAILHPLIRSTIEAQESTLKSKGKPLAILDIPLLTESSQWMKQLDGIIVVDCSPARQMTRVTARNGWTPQEAQAVMNAQASREQRLANATWVIDNDSDDLQHLQQQADAWQPF
jgi:dephospho-CoA kinase